MAEGVCYGTLLIQGREGGPSIEFPLDKTSILIGRDHSCDVRIVNKEISRKHAEVYVEDGAVFICSIGREPITVNGCPVLSPVELATGDKIEVQLENRTRVMFFQGNDETVQIKGSARMPLGDANALPQSTAVPAAVKAKEGGPPRLPAPAPPPPPPPPPPGGLLRAAKPPAGAPAPAPPPPPLPKPASNGGMPAALQEAIKAGVQLRKVQQEAKAVQRPAAVEPPCGMFVPNPADLLKLKAGLRKTAASSAPADAATEQPSAQPPAVAEAAAAPVAAEPQPTEEAEAGPVQAGEAAMEQDPVPAEAAAGPEAANPDAATAPEAAAGKQEAAPELPEAAAAADEAMPDAAGLVTPNAEEMDGAAEAAAAGAEEPAAEAAVAAVAGVPNSIMKKRVRFHVEQEQRMAGTPEGAARDTTITIRLRKGDIEQIINVDDNTVAFAQWGLGTMGAAEVMEELPDTVVSKKSRPSSALPSASKMQVPSALKDLVAASPMISTGAQPTPGAAGPAAPAPTPATGIRPAMPGATEVVVDPTTLAHRLAEMAEQHDVTLEVPADFFKSPAKDALRVVLTPKSKGKTPAPSGAVAQDAVPASAARSMPRSTGRSRLGQQADLAAQATSAGTAPVDAALEKTEEIDVPADLGTIQASVRRQSASRRRSVSRTPGTKIVIIDQATPGTRAGSVSKKQAQAATQSTPRLLSTIAIQTEAEDCGDDVQQEGSDEGGSADGSLEVEEAVEMVPLKQYQKAHLKAKAYHSEARQLAAQLRRMTAKAAKLKKAASALSAALEEERAKRQELQEAMQQVVLNRAAAELEQAAAEAEEEVEGAACEQEGAEVEMADAEQEAAEQAGDEEQQQAAAAPWVPRVVVLGQLSKAVSTAQRCGQVVIVRPTHLAAQAQAPAQPAAPAAATPGVVVLPASARKTPAPSAAKQARQAAARGVTPARPATERKTPAPSAAKGGLPQLPKSMLKEAPGTSNGKVVLENVELPGWLFEGEQQADEVAAATAVAAEEEVQEAVAASEQPEEVHEEAEAAEAPVAVEAVTAASPAVQPAQQEAAPAAAEEQVQEGEAEEEAQQAAEATMEVDDGEAAQAPQQEAAEEAAASDEEEAEDEGAEDFCHICGQSDEGDILLLCDSCDNACHLSCCNPPLKRVPKGDWFCIECTAKQQAEAAAAAAAKAAKAAAKRGANRAPKQQAAEEPEHAPAQLEPTKHARGRRGATAASADPAEAAPAEEAAAKGSRGRGSKRAATEDEPAPQPAGRSKRGKLAEPKPAAEEPAPSGRTRGKAAASAAAEEHEVSTRRGRAAAAPKAEAAAPARATRSRR